MPRHETPDLRPVTFEALDGVAVVTLRRPDARNAIDGETTRLLEAAVDRVEAADGLHVAVLTGAPPVFCAGADLKEIGAGRAETLVTERGGFAGFVRRRRTKPWIAAVDGPALAGGTEIVLACDMVVASTAARFGLPEVKRGLVAAGGGAFRIARHLPSALAMEAVLTGDPVELDVAVLHGMVNDVCDPGQARERAIELAQRVAVNAPVAVRESYALLKGPEARDEDAWRRSAEADAVVRATDDVREGVLAFIEKRPPVWAGR